VEDGTYPYLPSRSDGMFHGTMQGRRKQETDADLRNALLDFLRSNFKIYPELFKNIGAAAKRGDRPVAVLCHLDPAGGNDKGDRSRNIEAVRAVATGTYDIENRLPIDVDVITIDIEDASADPYRGRMLPHDAGGTGDLFDRLPLHPESGDEGTDLSLSRPPGHDLIHHLDHFAFTQVIMFNDFCYRFLDHACLPWGRRACTRLANTPRKGGRRPPLRILFRHLQKIIQDLHSAFGQDRLRMELHSPDR